MTDEKQNLIQATARIYMQTWRANMLAALPAVIEKTAFPTDPPADGQLTNEQSAAIASNAASIAAHLLGEELAMSRHAHQKAVEDLEIAEASTSILVPEVH